jgi:hypothetical protein
MTGFSRHPPCFRNWFSPIPVQILDRQILDTHVSQPNQSLDAQIRFWTHIFRSGRQQFRDTHRLRT